MAEYDPIRRGLAEFIGAFALTFVGAGAIMSAGGIRDPSLIGIAVAHGVTIAIMVSALGHISGGHFNPAITFGFLVTRRISLPLAGVYWVSQLGGATVAALLLKWIYPTSAVNGAKLGAPVLGTSIGQGTGFVVEMILTFFLVLVVFATAVDPRSMFKQVAGLAIGLTITVDVLIGGPLTGAAVNPSRAFGPMLVQNMWKHDWIWFVGPVAGGTLAALFYEHVYLRGRATAAA